MDEGKWASGRWQVKEGKADEFIERWGQWLGWTSQNVSGFRSTKLLRSDEDPLRFTSIADWDDDGSVRAWKTSENFRASIQSCRELCDEFLGGDFGVAVSFSAPTAVRI